ncbi:MAG: hypothetical protein ACLSH0_00175 [Mediterraneibacter faecis]
MAKELLSRVIDDARNMAVEQYRLQRLDMGVKLYTDFGFVHNGNFMQYKL